MGGMLDRIKALVPLAFAVLGWSWVGAATPEAAPASWATPAELSSYRTTPRYDETMAYLRRLVSAAPRTLRLETFGRTGEGRDLVVAIASKGGVFDPDAAKRAG